MNDLPLLQPALGHRAIRASQPRSTSDTPTRQRNTDDLLSRLTPSTAVDALRNPSGELKRCMDAASPSEQAFAMKVAVASKNIQEWLDELSAWPWPTYDTSAGFERPPAKRRKLFSQMVASDVIPDSLEGGEAYEKSHLGSLLASEVVRYERRIQEIGQDMEDLDVEEIKNHVLHNHIMPLSRPGTPMSDSLRSSTLSASTYARMDDFTALITATIVQALPNLSKLTRLLHTWSVRLLVLRKSSSFLTALVDAEIALKAGWKAMGTPPGTNSANADQAHEASSSGSALSRSEFHVMKLVLERKVAKAGQYLDFMLDALEGREDTLPEDWVDRMDSIEQEYAEWVATCERQIREAEWAKNARDARVAQDNSPKNITKEATSVPSQEASTTIGQLGDDTQSESTSTLGDPRSANGALNGLAATTVAAQPDGHHHGHGFDTVDEHEPPVPKTAATSPPVIMVHPAAEDRSGNGEPGQDQHISASAVPHTILDGPSTEEEWKSKGEQLHDISENEVPGFNGLTDTELSVDVDVPQLVPNGSSVQATSDPTYPASAPDPIPDDPEQATDAYVSEAVVDGPQAEFVTNTHTVGDGDGGQDSDLEFPDFDLPEPELPTLPQERRGSEVSNTSTVVHGLQSGVAGFSSDLPDHGTPEYRRFRDVVLPSTESDDVNFADDASLPSSPPDFRSSTRSLSVSFNEIPTVVEAPEEGSPPKTPLDVSFMADEDLPGEVGRHDSPSKMSAASADEQLQQQISEILDSIPAKIRLASEPPAVNLNPPDFSMPAARPKTKPEPFSRSYSSMSSRSSRAGTPSFTLAPAKNSRPRQQRGNQEIKLYHLSRSNGEPPIKLFIRCVGENGERVMVRVGGGWADLGEYLKEYASHHGRRGGEGKVEIRDLPHNISAASRAGSSPPSRPASAMDLASSPVTPLHVRKARRSIGATSGGGAGEEVNRAAAAAARQPLPKTPLANAATVAKSDNSNNNTPSTGGGSSSRSRSRSSSRLSWTEEDSSLGMAGPKAKHVEMSEENKAWVESVKEKVRIASGDQRAAAAAAAITGLAKSPAGTAAAATAAVTDPKLLPEGKFGELGKVGSTKRLFRRQAGPGAGSGPGAAAGAGSGSGSGLGK